MNQQKGGEWDWAGIKLATPKSAVGHVSDFVVRQVTDCATWPGLGYIALLFMMIIWAWTQENLS